MLQHREADGAHHRALPAPKWPVTRRAKIGLAIVTLLPYVYFALLFTITVPQSGEEHMSPAAAFLFHHPGPPVLLLVLAAQVCLYHLLTTSRLTANGIAAWLLFLFFAAPVAVPLYQYFVIWQGEAWT